MLRHLHILIFLTLTVASIRCKSLLPKIGECPKYASVNDLDFTKLTGEWYDLATDKESSDQSMSCSKLNLKIDENGTFSLDVSQIKINGMEMVTSMKFSNSAETPSDGYLRFDITVEDDTWLGTKTRDTTALISVIYTDYDNITVFFTCFETKSLFFSIPHRTFNIVVRKRSFDSLSQFKAALEPLIQLGIDLNDLNFIFNGQTCKN